MMDLAAEHETHARRIQQADLLDPVIHQVDLTDTHVSNSSSTEVLNDTAVPAPAPCSGFHRKRSRVSRSSTWLFLAYVLGLLVVVSLCSRIGQNATGSGLAVRRLGSMGGPAGVELDADELAELCLEMGEWKPIEPLFGGGRASPAIVEMVFESLTVAPADESSTSGVNPYEGFQSTHRLPIVNGHAHGSEEPLSTDEDMDSDSASLDFCSYRCPVGILSVPPESSGSSHASLETQSEGNLALLTQLRKGQGSQPQRRHSAHCCPTSTEHGTDTGGAAHKPLRQSCSDPTTAKPRSYLQAIEEEASSSSSSESRPHRGIPVGRTSRDAHPFVRLPLLEPGADKDLPDLRALNLRGRSPLLAHSLKIVRSFLMKPILNKIEVIELLKCEATMLRQAAQLIALSVDNLNPSSAVEVLGRRFLVLQALHSVAKLLGDHVANNVWYKSVFALLPSSYSKRFRRSFGRWSERYIILSRDLIEAMEMYRVGDEPSAERIIDLKRRLLCLPDSPSGFRRVAWSIWRTDDMLFQGRS